MEDYPGLLAMGLRGLLGAGRQTLSGMQKDPNLMGSLLKTYQNANNEFPVASGLLGALSPLGAPMAGADFEVARREGNPFGMGLAALGVLPGVRPTRKLISGWRDIVEPPPKGRNDPTISGR